MSTRLNATGSQRPQVTIARAIRHPPTHPSQRQCDGFPVRLLRLP